MVYYRKYRPQVISELDSKEVREKLFAILSGKSVSHAFLFTGPKGLGKTSAARIVAKVVNCEKRSKSVESCNKCHQCTSITNGTNLDVLEIDGASNRGIDEIRDLREKIRLSPIAASKKVYIIDEVHMLTTEAFNALLKMLEEPPSHAIFILCTTEPHKVPQTIVSRCFHITFRRASEEELVRSFKRIATGEKLVIEDEALHVLTKLSDSSFRDGAKIIEEIALLASDKKITKELVEEKFKIASFAHYQVDLIDYLKRRDTKEALLLISKLAKQGNDIKYFIEQFIDTLHKNLLAKLEIESSQWNSPLEIDEIKNLVQLLTKAHQEIKYAPLPQLPLELAIIEFAQRSQNQVEQQHTQPNSDTAFWYQLIDAVKQHNHSLAGVLRGCKMKSMDDKNLVIETPYKFHKEKLEDKKILELLGKTVQEITGNAIEVLVVLKDRPA
ncbi:DNA polymerase III subunit gamma/tau [Candidatus Shapirobacteria bacterium]|nr:DNA polymerase III subunit gamma/tau [Candidatus Shapirobacteria bacterium]